MTKMSCNDTYPLTAEQRQVLESRGCSAQDWSLVTVSERTDVGRIRNVRFEGEVSIGALGDTGAGDCIENARIISCRIGDNVEIRNIGGELRGCTVGDRARIVNTARITFEPEAPCGLLTPVDVLDETGSRPVRIYPGLSAQTAWLAAHNPHWAEDVLFPMLDEEFPSSPEHRIGEEAQIIDSGVLRNVCVGDRVCIEGARSLRNGMIVNNAPRGRNAAYVGSGVDAENFIIEDGSVDSGSLLRNCYVGQGVEVDKGFTAHDTLMFANTSLENGEACALFAGPYTVSMHKSTLLIACETSFMNAGSGTNQSNHMYKLGPVHWGIMERGAKTASSSYIMWGARVGPFSLLMGTHKNHPDASDFPFSYLFGDDKGATTVVPGMMLRSCGLQRDEKKWPMRDRRVKRRIPRHDRINFEVLNPMTVSRMRHAGNIIEELMKKGPDDDLFMRYKGMKFRAPSLDRAQKYYTLATAYYLKQALGESEFGTPAEDAPSGDWMDIAGQIVERRDIERAMQAESLAALEQVFTDAAEAYPERQRKWIDATFADYWGERRQLMDEYAAQFEKLIEDDRTAYRRSLSDELAMLS